jgi:hypothetical protein
MGNIVRTQYGHVNHISLAFLFICPYHVRMTKRGRPKNPKGTGKGDYMELRLDAAEKQAFWDAAELAGMALSVWVRERLRRAARRELEDADKPVPFLGRASA